MMGTKCPKCGLMQMPRPACKSCGTSLDVRVSHPTPAIAAPTTTGAAPPPRRSGPIYRTDEPPPILDSLTPQEPPPFLVQAAPSAYGTNGDRLHGLFFYGTGGSLFGIHVVNIFLTILTLGLYYFWGKVRVRSYVLSQTEIAGDRFAYHGTGKELLTGFLKAMLLFGIPVTGLMFGPKVMGASDPVRIVAFVIAYILFLVFLPAAMVGARRYRLSRTSWRGIRFSFRGPVADFIKLFVGGSLLTMVTLGLYYPFFETRRHGFMVSHSYFGNQKFEFDGHGRDLFGSFVLTTLLYLPTLGLSWFWFQAKKQRYYWECTRFGNVRFRSTVTGGRLLLLTLGNMLILVATLGFGWPWVVVRNIRFTCRYLSLEGSADLAQIKQEAQKVSATGEGLASFLDLDAGFDFG